MTSHRRHRQRRHDDDDDATSISSLAQVARRVDSLLLSTRRGLWDAMVESRGALGRTIWRSVYMKSGPIEQSASEIIEFASACCTSYQEVVTE